ncbi:S-layer homology domain-containing protein [Thermohalobacter berrensis]|uniref:SLH domain-containing protein n=1 Tax=Thermohalobacter berrensis TaxID=99594 RepID=A0A419T5I5_9FIRM|nr:S-layer homology domain-containing protein [Thermohalobacter berrensis]RKD32712.1 hypothetical protein BET03_10270 [Thermohalobacter berrensis]
MRKLISIFIILSLLISNISIVNADKFYLDVFGHWAEDVIMWATNEVELLEGYDDGTFRPDNNITRSEYITLLFRTANEQEVINNLESEENIKLQTSKTDKNTSVNKIANPNENNIEDKDVEEKKKELPFEDVNNEFWAFDEIKAIYTYINKQNKEIKFEDIFPGDKFQPNKKITREEAVILSSFFTTPPIEDKKEEFNDISNDYEYYDQIMMLADNGIIEGYDDNTFKPKSNITRAEAVTVMKRIYFDMEFLKGNYMNDIQLISTENDNKFVLFGDYENRDLSKEDIIYKRAISTLEYKSLTDYIPYEEQHLYDDNPIETLKELKDKGYENIIGVNYYLIKFANLSNAEKKNLYNEILEEYLNRDDLKDMESILIFTGADKYLEETEKLLEAIDYWYNITDNNEELYNIVFLKSKLYKNNGELEKALGLYNDVVENEDIENAPLEIQKKIIMNIAYLLMEMGEFDKAEVLLKEGWNSIKNNKEYVAYSNEIDKDFKGSIKKILIKKMETSS